MSHAPSRENLPVLEQYRQGLVNRWNEMMSVIDDERSFTTRFRMMIAELQDLATDDEIVILKSSIAELSKQEKYKKSEAPEKDALADKLNVLSEIFRSRVVSARWILPFESEGRGGFGQGVSSTVQQNIQSNFFKLDYSSLYEIYFFVRQVELLLHNTEHSDDTHTFITYYLDTLL